MGEAWIDLVDSSNVYEWSGPLRDELNEHPEFWEPYQTVNHVMNKVFDGRYQVWMGGVEPGVPCIWGLTELRTHSACTAITVLWCSGDHGPEFYARWLEALERLCGILRIDRIVIEAGRPGWERVFSPLGFRVAAIELVKDIEHVKQTAIKRNADE